MSESQHKAFFDAHGERLMDTWFGGASESFAVEELYQAFKSRFIAELCGLGVIIPGGCRFTQDGELVEMMCIDCAGRGSCENELLGRFLSMQEQRARG